MLSTVMKYFNDSKVEPLSGFRQVLHHACLIYLINTLVLGYRLSALLIPLLLAQSITLEAFVHSHTQLVKSTKNPTYLSPPTRCPRLRPKRDENGTYTYSCACVPYLYPKFFQPRFRRGGTCERGLLLRRLQGQPPDHLLLRLRLLLHRHLPVSVRAVRVLHRRMQRRFLI